MLDAYLIEKIIDSGKTADSDIYMEYAAKAKTEGSTWQADNHQLLTYGDASLQILTGPEDWEDLNDYSVICLLDTGDVEMLFVGDAETMAEANLLAQSNIITSEVLKVGHHGSSTSTSALFLERVKPKFAIISVGAGNRYKHHSEETVQRLKDAGATVFRTDINGNIVVETDGKTCTVTPWRLTPVEAPTSQPQPQPVTPQPQPQVQPVPEQTQAPATEGQYVGSSESDKYHYPSCRYAQKISSENSVWFKDAADAQAKGYVPCGVCKP